NIETERRVRPSMNRWTAPADASPSHRSRSPLRLRYPGYLLGPFGAPDRCWLSVRDQARCCPEPVQSPGECAIRDASGESSASHTLQRSLAVASSASVAAKVP